ncbi:MAG TPA: N-methyl-D-aspartate receptor NMDAR2C subunit [Dyella sp.]|uniref:HD domain-containing protein n=1 Tax=Dyella sp. TaxID=1869338 RepID=UPI002F952832
MSVSIDPDGHTGATHWHALWASWRRPAPEALHDALLERYAERHRAYHTRQHLEECLAQLADMQSHAERPHELALALWFHDAIYWPRRKDNEAASAAWLTQAAQQAQIEAEAIQRMHALVMATVHDASPDKTDARLLVDIDLAILGAEPSRFDEYERQIRREYRWVPEPLYRAKRAEVLRRFLDRPAVYVTPWMAGRFEARARGNLDAALRKLEQVSSVRRMGFGQTGP